MTRTSWIAGVALFLASCGGDRIAEGPGSETSGFSARVVDARGRPVAAVEVRVVPLDGRWISGFGRTTDPVLERALTDADGWARFSTIPTGRVALESGDAHGSGRVELDSVGSGSILPVALSEGGAARIRPVVPGESVRAVGIVGTGRDAVQTSPGVWSLEGVPSGTYAVAARTDSGTAMLGRIRIGSMATIDTVLRSDVDSVLLEDFGLPSIRNRYGDLLGAGWWYTSTDAVYGGGSKAMPENVPDAVVACGTGACLEMDFAIDSAEPRKFALVGMDLDRSAVPGSPKARLADLSKVAALAFEASGTGTFRVQFHFDAPGGSTTCGAPVRLDSSWRRREVPFASLSCDAATVDFHAAIGLTILTTSDAHLRLGRVSLVGAGPRAVFSELGGSP